MCRWRRPVSGRHADRERPVERQRGDAAAQRAHARRHCQGQRALGERGRCLESEQGGLADPDQYGDRRRSGCRAGGTTATQRRASGGLREPPGSVAGWRGRCKRLDADLRRWLRGVGAACLGGILPRGGGDLLGAGGDLERHSGAARLGRAGRAGRRGFRTAARGTSVVGHLQQAGRHTQVVRQRAGLARAHAVIRSATIRCTLPDAGTCR